MNIGRLYLGSIMITKNLHNWLIKDPPNCKPVFEGINIILIGINSIVATDYIIPNALPNLISNINSVYISLVKGIIFLTIMVIYWGIKGLWEVRMGRKIEMPIKYKFLISLLSIPLLIFINKLLIWIKITNKNYEQQNNSNN